MVQNLRSLITCKYTVDILGSQNVFLDLMAFRPQYGALGLLVPRPRSQRPNAEHVAKRNGVADRFPLHHDGPYVSVL